MSRLRINLNQPLTKVTLRNTRVTSSNNLSLKKEAQIQQETDRQQKLIAQQQLQQKQMLNDMLAELAFAVKEIEDRRKASLHELQEIAIELAIAAASHIVQTEILSGAINVEQLIQKSLAQLPVATPAIVRVHPADLQILKTENADFQRTCDASLLQLFPDSTIARGAVRLETNSGHIVHTDVATKLEQIRQTWMEQLDDAQTERRKTQGDADALQRFPNRRETA